MVDATIMKYMSPGVGEMPLSVCLGVECQVKKNWQIPRGVPREGGGGGCSLN